jgi:hypothetical protein
MEISLLFSCYFFFGSLFSSYIAVSLIIHKLGFQIN